MPNLSNFFMKTAFLISQESKCVSHKVGSIIVKDNRIVSMGYNGTPSGFINCNEHFNCHSFSREEHSKWSRDREIHAEMNTLMYALYNNINVREGDMYVTMTPCNDCIKSIIQSGIKNIYYFYEYDHANIIPEMLNYINIEQFKNKELETFIQRNDIKFKNTNYE